MGTLASELRSVVGALGAVPRVYADANLPLAAVAAMRQQLGWDVLFVLEHDDLRRASDVDHFRCAREFGRTLITLDHDFLDDRRFPPQASPGVIVCAAGDARTLLRIARYLDAEVFRGPAGHGQPLLGRKLIVTSDVLRGPGGQGGQSTAG